MKIPDLVNIVDSVVNFVPNKCHDLAFRVIEAPESAALNYLSPLSYTIGLSAEAGAIGYAAGAFNHNSYVGWGAAAATLAVSLAVKCLKKFYYD